MQIEVKKKIGDFIKAECPFLQVLVKRIISGKSTLIEVAGPEGSGKSIILQALAGELSKISVKYEIFNPRLFRFNQLFTVLTLISDITFEQFQEILAASERYSPSNQYDFFYFLSEQLNELDLFKEVTVLINNYQLDNFTKDFIQYIVEYSEDKPLNFVVFSPEHYFPFAERFETHHLSLEELHKLLVNIYEMPPRELLSESEVLYSITQGSLAMLEHILLESEDEEKSRPNLNRFIELDYKNKSLVELRFEPLNESERELLLFIYMVDTAICAKDLSKFLTITKIEESIKRFSAKNYLEEGPDGCYEIRRKGSFTRFYNLLSLDVKNRILKQVIAYYRSNNALFSVICYYQYLKGEYEEESFQKMLEVLRKERDYNALSQLYTFMRDTAKNGKKELEAIKNLGIVKKVTGDYEQAAECFREALKICTKKHYPAEEIVFHLAETLNINNSPTFALEIIKKYSPDEIDPLWEAKILLLKTEILTDQEDFAEAAAYLDMAQEAANKVKDLYQQKTLLATVKKVLGKFYYLQNEWEKAELEYIKAEKYFAQIDNSEGLAAIYNNIGVLALFQSEWQKAETMYNKSLELEKKRFSLNGISVCYNNIGYLIEEKGDYKESLTYFNEALRIQKLLSNRFNLVNIYLNIGVTYMDNGEFTQAAKVLEECLQMAINFNLYRNTIAALNNLGSLYYKWGNWSKAIEYYQGAVDKSEETHFLEGLLRSYNNLGELYETKSEYNIAYDLYSKGLKYFSEISDEYLKNELRGNMGSVLAYMHKFGEAYPYLIESYEYFKNLHAKDKTAEGALKLTSYFISMRNYENADYYLKQAIGLAREINNKLQLGKAGLLNSELNLKNPEKAKEILEEAIENFIATKAKFEITLASYKLACVLADMNKWEEAINLLKNNTDAIKQFGAISLLEKNDLLLVRLQKEHANELNELQSQDSILDDFYEITKRLNSLTDFDTLLDASLDNLCSLAKADGGILCLYNGRDLPESWEYKLFKNFGSEYPDYSLLMDIIGRSFTEKNGLNLKQPSSAPRFTHIVTHVLTERSHIVGILLLFITQKSRYFNEKIYNLTNALCNQLVVIIENIRHTNLARSHEIIRKELTSSEVFSNIIGKSKQMLGIFATIDKIKDTPTTILLEGASGTGKELLARAIHFSSNRRNKSFIAQYCGALPETLLESELFGHVKGSFTGAAYDKKGLFEVADGGTFFLDEIADISLSTQAKLLRFLQEGEIKRVGSTKTTHVDVRVVCATNVSLQEKVKKGEFRLDLYYRLNVIRVTVPSLKERKSDIPLLSIHFLDKYNKKVGKKVQGITDEAMKYLASCDWPGNIRQLENEIERAVTLAENDSFIKPSDLSEEVFKFTEHAQTVELLDKMTIKDAVEHLEKQMVEKALDEHNWNQTKAAKDLGLSRQGLIKKMKRYNLDH